MKLLKILFVFFLAMAMFGIGGLVASAQMPAIQDQEFHKTGMLGDIPIEIDCVIKDGTITITVTGQVPGSFTVQEEQ